MSENKFREENSEDSSKEKEKIKRLGLDDLSQQGFARLMEHKKPKQPEDSEHKPFVF